MALTGHLSDLSLSELIEFFCNQRKTGRLKVRYPKGAGYFNLQTGSVVDAKIGVLRGIDAVYYALTLPNAAFEFSASAEATERTINQPWTQVVLEGLRRLDEGMIPPEAFPPSFVAEDTVVETDDLDVDSGSARAWHVPAFLSMMSGESMSHRKPLIAGAVAVAVILSVAAIGVPAGWYGRSKPVASNQPDSSASSQSQPAVTTDSGDMAQGAAFHRLQAERARMRHLQAERHAGIDGETRAHPLVGLVVSRERTSLVASRANHQRRRRKQTGAEESYRASYIRRIWSSGAGVRGRCDRPPYCASETLSAGQSGHCNDHDSDQLR